MKAKVKATGEIIDVKLYEYDSYLGDMILREDSLNSSARKFPESELELIPSMPSPIVVQPKEIDWEQRTWQASVEILAAIMSRNNIKLNDLPHEQLAIRKAKVLVEKYKKQLEK